MNFRLVPCSVTVSVTVLLPPLLRFSVNEAVEVEVPAAIVRALDPVGDTEPLPDAARSIVWADAVFTALPNESAIETVAVSTLPELLASAVEE